MRVQCPDCETAIAARDAVVDARFWEHLFAIAAPLAVLVVVTLLIFRYGGAVHR